MMDDLYPKTPIPFADGANVLFVHFLFNNEGDCAILEVPTSEGTRANLLIDMGEAPNWEWSGIGMVRWFLRHFVPAGNRKIHYAIISHWHDDHCSGFDELLADAEVAPDCLWVPQYISLEGRRSKTFRKIRNRPGIEEKLRFLKAGDVFEIPEAGGDWALHAEVLGPTPRTVERMSRYLNVADLPYDPSAGLPSIVSKVENVLSLIIKFTFCGKVILFTGDAVDKEWDDLVPEKPRTSAWEDAMQPLVRCDLLKIPHHGSSYVPDNLRFAFDPPPQYAVSTYSGSTNVRKFDAYGRDINSKLEALGEPSASSINAPTEAIFHLGDLRVLEGRLMCSFAFVPDQRGSTAIIVPLIYEEVDSEVRYFIRPQEAETGHFKPQPARDS